MWLPGGEMNANYTGIDLINSIKKKSPTHWNWPLPSTCQLFLPRNSRIPLGICESRSQQKTTFRSQCNFTAVIRIRHYQTRHETHAQLLQFAAVKWEQEKLR